ncbi:MAG: hypothetical protein FWH21_05245 [Kiritimatiellaeota bacterium]|nr:hypothetical protein [Kiritimatiellota bacterium]
MKKRMCAIVCALPALIVSAQASRLSGTSLGAGMSSLKASEKTAPERKEDLLKPDTKDTVTKVVFSGPTSGWGFTKSPTPYYTLDGKNLGILPGGVLFDFSSVKTSSKNMVFEAKVKQGDDWTGPFLLDCTSLAVFEGKPDTIPSEILSDLTEYYSIKAKIAERKAEIEKTTHERSPHFASAKRAQERYAESIKQATELNEKAEKQTGPARSKSLDQLRALKYEQARIKAEADKEAASYKVWKEANPLAPEVFRDDPVLAALESQLAPLKVKLGALATED